MPVSKIAHHRNQIEHVLKLTNQIPKNKHMGHDTLRSMLDALPEITVFRAGVADFWMDISKQKGAKWRQTEPPVSPFYPEGKKELAKKLVIRPWWDEWRQRELIARGVKTKVISVDQGRSMVEELAYENSPWLLGFFNKTEAVIGHAAWLPANAEPIIENHPTKDLDVRWMRPGKALRLPWIDADEASTWQTVLATCHRAIAADIESKILRRATPPIVDPTI